MTRDELTAIIYARLIAPYGEFLTPGTAGQFQRCLTQAMDDAMPLIEAHIEAEVKRRIHVSPIPTNSIDQRNARIRTAYENGQSMREIAAEHGLSYQRVHQILARLGVAARPPQMSLDIAPETLLAAYQSGETVREIARRSGMTMERVRKALRRQGVTPIPSHSAFKNKAERDSFITTSYQDGNTVPEIAIATGLSAGTVTKIIRMHGVEIRKRGMKIDHQRDRRAAELYLQGRSLKEVAAELGISAAGVSLALSRQGVKARPRHSRSGGTVTSLPEAKRKEAGLTPPARTVKVMPPMRKAG